MPTSRCCQRPQTQDKDAVQITVVLDVDIADFPRDQNSIFRDEVKQDIARAAGHGVCVRARARVCVCF